MDFSHVTSLDQAQQLKQAGQLFEMLLFPAELGGERRPENIVFVPAGISEAKAELTATVLALLREGRVDQLSVTPEYQGQSFVPSKIKLKAWHSQKFGVFEPSIAIW